jgi:putative ABC transport system permease protein
VTRRGVAAALSRIGEGVVIALDSLRANKVRAALTILGVAIGVTVVIAMGAAITGINRSISGILEQAGPKTFFVFRWFESGIHVGPDDPREANPQLTLEDADRLRALSSVRDVSVSEFAQGPVSYEDVNLKGVNMAGFTPNWIQVNGGDILQGRNFTQAEYLTGQHVVVINDILAKELFPGLDPVGKVIRIFGQPFTVVGMHAEPASLFSNADESRLAIPHTAFIKVAEYEKGFMQFAVVPTATASVQEAQDDVIAALRTARGLRPGTDNNFAVISQNKLLDTFNSITAGFFIAMIALSSVGLMVGGVGVVAIMMISVTERTREIGVRKALGATRREIMFQFLVEAATLTLVGCLIGMALGAGIAWAVRTYSPVPATVPFYSVVAAVLASILTGVLFGLYPASKASRLDPVEALRYE